MIKIKYKALFTLDFPHPFYTSGKCRDLEILPSAGCIALIKSLGLHLLPNEFGATLYGKVNEIDLMNNAIPEGTKFSFLIKLKNHSFENISNLNLSRPAANRYYFNNLKINLADGQPLLVSDATSKVVSDSDSMVFVSNSFSFSDTSTAVTETGKILFLDSGETLEQTLKNDQNRFNFSFDLNKASCGRAVFSVGGTEKKTFFSIAAEDLPDTFGVIEIFFNTSLPTENQFQQADHSITTKNYRIAFANRATTWRYIITKAFNQSITGVFVAKTSGTAINFTSASGAISGKFIATSNNVLPLTEKSITGITLTDENDKVLVMSLPNPPVNLVKTEGTDTFSDILITI
ncbi:hypothetical protein ACVWYG_000084 [Pedobacter sp. UYEF25]